MLRHLKDQVLLIRNKTTLLKKIKNKNTLSKKKRNKTMQALICQISKFTSQKTSFNNESWDFLLITTMYETFGNTDGLLPFLIWANESSARRSNNYATSVWVVADPQPGLLPRPAVTLCVYGHSPSLLWRVINKTHLRSVCACVRVCV